MKPGDLIYFARPDHMSQIDKHPDWDRPKIGLFLDVTMSRPDDVKFGDELLVLHEGERWSVPRNWCRPIKERE